MSYILDALKKSDRERQHEAPLHLQPLYETSPSFENFGGPRRRRWPYLLLVGLLLSGALLKWSDWNPRVSRERQGADGEIPAEATQSTPPPAELAVRQGTADQSSPLPKKDFPPASEESIAPAAAEPGDLPPVVKLAAAPNKKPTALVMIRRDREKVFMAPQDGTTVIGRPQPAPIVQAEPSPPAIRSAENPPTVTWSETSQPREPQPVVSAVAPQPAPSEQPRGDIPYLHDLPQQLQAEIPKLGFAGHAYALNPAQRLIVINGKIMREGDYIDAATTLQEITWEGVIIGRKGVRFQVKCY